MTKGTSYAVGPTPCLGRPVLYPVRPRHTGVPIHLSRDTAFVENHGIHWTRRSVRHFLICPLQLLCEFAPKAWHGAVLRVPLAVTHCALRAAPSRPGRKPCLDWMELGNFERVGSSYSTERSLTFTKSTGQVWLWQSTLLLTGQEDRMGQCELPFCHIFVYSWGQERK